MDGAMIMNLAAIFVLLLMSAFFSGSETALTAASKARMHAKAKEGDKRAAMVNKMREKKDRMIGALLLGNNLVNILSSSLATGVLIQMFGQQGIFYATFIMTAMILVFSEVLPKTYALHDAEDVAMKVAPFVRIVIMLLAPVTELVARIVRGVLHMFGVDISMVRAGSHMEVLRGAIDLHQGPEEETNAQRAMLRSILDLADVTVEEVMTHRNNMVTMDAARPLDEIITEMLDGPYTRIPLWRDDPDNIVGVINTKALLREMKARAGKTTRIDVEMIANEPWFIPNTTTLFDQLQAFRQRREHFALVVDEYGTLMGLTTLEDILEEIVGEIDDELDQIVAGVRRQSNGSYMVDGTVTIRDLNREFEWNLPDEEYTTLAGLVLYESQMLPEVGRSFHFHGFRFDVVRRHRNQLTLIRITPPAKKSAGEAA